MKLKLYYIEKIYNGIQHDGYEEPLLQYWCEIKSEWVDVDKVYSDKEL